MFEDANFKTPLEFYNKKEYIRKEYMSWSYGRKYMYKCYVYSRDFIVNKKNLIWEYLNEPEDSIYFIKACIDMVAFKRSDKK